jgi:RNA polymerase sigma-70 factor (ECF subfamily)
VIAESVMASEAMAVERQEKDLLETMVLEHSRLVYRIAFSVLRNPAEAEDAAQETFLRVLRFGKKLDGVRDPRAWLAQIAWRVAVERRRQTTRTPRGTEEGAQEVPSPRPGVDQVLLEQERTVLLDRLIAALPDELRDALVLSTIEEIAPRDVASVLGISEAAVRSRTFRARQILREKLLVMLSMRK